MSDKIQSSEKLTETDQRDTRIQAEEFNRQPISALHYKVREEWSKVFNQPILIYPVTLQELPNDSYPQGCVRADWKPVEILG